MLELAAAAAASSSRRLVAGASGTTRGYTTALPIGSLTPDEFKGETVRGITTQSTGASYQFSVGVQDIGADWWSRITIIGVFASGQQVLVWDRVGDGFTYAGNSPSGVSTWTLTGSGLEVMVDGNVYTVSIAA